MESIGRTVTVTISERLLLLLFKACDNYGRSKPVSKRYGCNTFILGIYLAKTFVVVIWTVYLLHKLMQNIQKSVLIFQIEFVLHFFNSSTRIEET